MTNPQKPFPQRDSIPENYTQQDIGQNPGQALGQIFGGQAINISGGIVSFQDSQGRVLSRTSANVEKTIPWLLPYLSNRYEQQLELRQAVRELLMHKPRRPLFCIIHGDECQSQDTLLERFKAALPQWLNLDPKKTTVKSYPLVGWRPSSLKRLNKLHTRLRQNLADRVVDKSLLNSSLADDGSALSRQINQIFGQYPGPVMVELHLRTNDLQDLGANLIPKILEFWQDWPDLAPNQTLIICLSIKYLLNRPMKRLKWWFFLNPIPWLRRLHKYRYRRHLNCKIEQQINLLADSKFKEFDRLSGVVLTKLDNVTQSHVEDWVRSEETKIFAGELVLGQLMNDIGKMFDQWERETASRTISMDELAGGLEALLKSAIAGRSIN